MLNNYQIEELYYSEEKQEIEKSMAKKQSKKVVPPPRRNGPMNDNGNIKNWQHVHGDGRHVYARSYLMSWTCYNPPQPIKKGTKEYGKPCKCPCCKSGKFQNLME